MVFLIKFIALKIMIVEYLLKIRAWMDKNILIYCNYCLMLFRPIQSCLITFGHSLVLVLHPHLHLINMP